MDRDDWWVARFSDNRLRGLLAELVEAINDCEDAEALYRLRSTLSVGLTNHAAKREREVRNDTDRISRRD